MAVRRTPVRLHIGRLVLDGLPAGDPAGLGRAVEAELTRLLKDGSTPFDSARGTSIDRLDAGELSWGDGSSSETLGARLAGAVYGSLGGERQ
jgi:hypothetical protein